MKPYLFAALILLSGCAPEPTQTMYKVPLTLQNRFCVTRVGVIADDLAYGQRRGIYIINDADSGKEYIGISGVGIAETGVHLHGKYSSPDER